VVAAQRCPRREQSLPVKGSSSSSTTRRRLRPGCGLSCEDLGTSRGARQAQLCRHRFLPIVEKEAGAQLRSFLRTWSPHDGCPWDENIRVERQRRALASKANFWLLAGKLLRDKQVPKFTRLNLQDVQEVFDRVAEHYDAQRVRSDGRLKALRGRRRCGGFCVACAASARRLWAALRGGAPFGSHAQLFSVHRTPVSGGLYAGETQRWMEDDIGIQNCGFRTGCGHSFFWSELCGC